MELRIIAISILFLLLPVAVLYFTNFSRPKRYLQRWIPIFAISYSGVAIWMHYNHQLVITGAAVEVADQILKEYLGVDYGKVNGSYVSLYFFNLTILAVFAALKIFLHLSFVTIAALKKAVRFIASKVSKKNFLHSVPGSELWPAYYFHFDRGVSIKHHWGFYGGYVRLLALFSFLLLAVGAVCFLIFPSASVTEHLPRLLVVPFIVFVEFSWYLGGRMEVKTDVGFAGENVRSSARGGIYRLRKVYSTIWSERLLASGNVNRAVEKTPRSESFLEIPGDVESEFKTIVRNLSLHGRALSQTQKNILVQLLRGRDALIYESSFSQSAGVLFPALQKDIVDGFNVLFLAPLRTSEQTCGELVEWVTRWLGTQGYAKTNTAVEYNVFDYDGVAIATIHDLLNSQVRENQVWFSSLKTVVIVDTEEAVLQDISEAITLWYVLNDLSRLDRLQTVGLASSNPLNLEASLRELPGYTPIEYSISPIMPAELSYLAWSVEGNELFQEAILQVSIPDIGMHGPLALPALRDGLFAIQGVGFCKTGWFESVEEIDKVLEDAKVQNILHSNNFSFLTFPESIAVVMAFDEKENLPLCIKRAGSFARKGALVLAVSPPYLLREYFADNLEFYTSNNAPLVSLLSPMPLYDRWTVACSLAQWMSLAYVKETSISKLLSNIPKAKQSRNTYNSVAEELDELFSEVFDLKIFREGKVTRKTEYEFVDGPQPRFRAIDAFMLLESLVEIAGEAFASFYTLKAPDNSTIALIPCDHLYQTYLPRQIHAFHGRPFMIEEIDKVNKTVRVQKSVKMERRYRTLYNIEFDLHGSVHHTQAARHQDDRGRCQPLVILSKKKHIDSLVISIDILEQPFRVATVGYYTLQGEARVNTLEYTPFEKGEIPERMYSNGRVMRLSIRRSGQGSRSDEYLGRLSKTFAVFFNEIIKSILPDAGRFILVPTTEKARDSFINSPVGFLPQLTGQSEVGDIDNSTLNLLLIEDSSLDTGVFKTLYDNWQAIFSLIEDYLLWLTKRIESGLELGFLSFGGTSVPEELLIPEALELCSLLTRTYPSRLAGKRNSVFKEGFEDKDDAPRVCDFCGEATSSEYQTYEDGRDQCYHCQRTAIKTVNELKLVYRCARRWMKESFNIELRRGITVNFTTAESIASQRGISFITSPGFDHRAIGFSYRDQDRHSAGIYIENGQPYHMTLGTMVHELTHIWQFDNLEIKDMGKEKTEGHAMWVEIHCLLGNGLGVEYCNHEKQRTDFYGRGYRFIERLIQEDERGRDPFTLLLELHGKKTAVT